MAWVRAGFGLQKTQLAPLLPNGLEMFGLIVIKPKVHVIRTHHANSYPVLECKICLVKQLSFADPSTLIRHNASVNENNLFEYLQIIGKPV